MKELSNRERSSKKEANLISTHRILAIVKANCLTCTTKAYYHTLHCWAAYTAPRKITIWKTRTMKTMKITCWLIQPLQPITIFWAVLKLIISIRHPRRKVPLKAKQYRIVLPSLTKSNKTTGTKITWTISSTWGNQLPLLTTIPLLLNHSPNNSSNSIPHREASRLAAALTSHSLDHLPFTLITHHIAQHITLTSIATSSKIWLMLPNKKPFNREWIRPIRTSTLLKSKILI